MDDDTRSFYFTLFNEIGIIEQLARSLMESRLPGDLTVPHFSVLNHCTRVRDGQTPLALARAFQVPKTTMTHTLAGLEKRDLVEIRPNPKDKRSKCVWITEKGKDFRIKAIASLDPDLSVFAEQFSKREIATLIPRLAEIRVMMDAHREGRES
ncbi:MAG: DNA-binding MarR family transcriptional regulator [Candidatus Pseudothioglobus sp.]|jgi:DNA-binding MarR family transcriptional regulator